MFSSPERRRRRSTSPARCDATPSNIRDRGGFDATPAKTSKPLQRDPFSLPGDEVKLKNVSAVRTDATKNDPPIAEAVARTSFATSANSIASLLVTRVEQGGAVEFLLDGNVYRVEDQAVLRSMLSEGAQVDQSTTGATFAALPAQPRRRSTHDFMKAQRAARAAANAAPSIEAPLFGAPKHMDEHTKKFVAAPAQQTARSEASGTASVGGGGVLRHQVGENEWCQLLVAHLGELPAAGATTSLAEEMGLGANIPNKMGADC
jgi:hypothetical protein